MRIDDFRTGHRGKKRQLLEDPHLLALDAKTSDLEASGRRGAGIGVAVDIAPSMHTRVDAELLPADHLEGGEDRAQLALLRHEDDRRPLHRHEAAAGQVLEVRAGNDRDNVKALGSPSNGGALPVGVDGFQR